jgi:uncharacterized membrane protein YfcA
MPTLLGIPLDIALLTSAHQFVVKAVLGIVISSFSVFALIQQPPELHSESRPWLLGCGFIAGVLGGAYGMNGPPLVIYGAMRRWSPQHVRATLQGYFLPGERCRDVWILARGPLEPCGQALFSRLLVCGGARDIPRP